MSARIAARLKALRGFFLVFLYLVRDSFAPIAVVDAEQQSADWIAPITAIEGRRISTPQFVVTHRFSRNGIATR